MIERHGTPARSRRLSALLAAGEWFPVRRALAVALDLANDLAAVERQGAVHLGVEPRTIELLGSGGARLRPPESRRSQGGGWFGFDRYGARYVAPEQIEGRADVDIRADLYAFGAVLFHMLNGAPAYPARSATELVRMHRTKTAPPIRAWREELPVPLARAVRTCLLRDRERRYPSTRPLMEELLAAAATLRR